MIYFEVSHSQLPTCPVAWLYICERIENLPSPTYSWNITYKAYVVFFKIGSYEEAKKAADAGVDAIIVQGRDAGGHVIGQV